MHFSAPVAVDAAFDAAALADAYAEIPASCAALDAFPAADFSAHLMLLRSMASAVRFEPEQP